MIRIDDARAADAGAMADLIRRSFAARPALDPPAPALAEDEESVATAVSETGGLVATLGGSIVGTLLFDESRPDGLGLRRVAVDPACQTSGVASSMVTRVEEIARDRGLDHVWLRVREELPATVRFWLRRGYERIGTEGAHSIIAKPLPVSVIVESPARMHALAGQLAPLLTAGDVLILNGELGAGKTTFVQGLADAMEVRGPVTSPTFVLSRVHPALAGGPALVHVDAYRLGSGAEVDDLDLDATVPTSVTAIEWGRDRAEQLADSWLDISIDTDGTTDGEEPARRVIVVPHGSRWAGIALHSALHG